MSTDPGEAKIIRTAIVDDHLVLTDALKMIIENQADIRVVEVAGTCAACLEMLPRQRPDVLLLDVCLPDGDGLDLVPQIKRLSPETSILVLTSLSDEATLLRAMEQGVNGFVAKNRGLGEVITSIRQAALGEIAIPTSYLLGLLGRTASTRPPAPAAQPRITLTLREREILSWLAQGLSGVEIAEKLCLSPLTVRTHIRNLMDKLGVHSRLEAVTFGLKIGLIDPPV